MSGIRRSRPSEFLLSMLNVNVLSVSTFGIISKTMLNSPCLRLMEGTSTPFLVARKNRVVWIQILEVCLILKIVVWIQILEVCLNFEGNQFTWCNNQRGRRRIWELLDRFLCIGDATLKFPHLKVRHLTRTPWDHAPLLLSINPLQTFRTSFVF